MASLQARHSRSCDLGKPWTPFERAAEGCTCRGGPTYYVAIREGRKIHRERVGKNRKLAQRALTKIQAQVDEGEFRAQRNVKFAVWAEEWLLGLERPKPRTILGYAQTMAYATEVFGEKSVRRLEPLDVKRFLADLRQKGMSDSSRAKHLRVLGACLESAVRSSCAGMNPVRLIPKQERPQAKDKTRESAYFTDEELPRLFREVADSVYLVLLKTALMTGMRQGELLALTWHDVDLISGVIHIRRSYTRRTVDTPKSFTSKRDVHLPSELIGLVGRWWGDCGQPDEEKLVFAGAGKDGYLSAETLTKTILYPAMNRAGIPREGPTGERRTFHSLRHTFARLALENGRDLPWLSRHLGHSSIMVTTGTYGHFDREAHRRQVEALEGVFPI
jgi:integrase